MLPIGKIAEAARAKETAIRHCEQIGLLPSHHNGATGRGLRPPCQAERVTSGARGHGRTMCA